MKYVLALVAGVFLMNYAQSSGMLSSKKVSKYKKLMYAYIPMMKYKRLLRAYR